MVPALRRFFASAGVAMLLPVCVMAQQPAVITGKVTGDNGRPLPNATVSLSQIGIGGTTREDGRYTILVPANRVSGQEVTLTARAINFKPQTVTLTLSAGQTVQDFSLASNPLQLGELVVTGAGTQSEVEKLGSVRNSVSGQEISNSNEPNAIAALSAKAPNVTITTSGGTPGASSFIQIRGPRTYNTNSQPLIVVDGLPIDYQTVSTQNFDQPDQSGPSAGGDTQSRISDINPNDIESVEILKGPAASSVYGARAAAGAILITTKKGKPGETRYSLRSNLEFNKPTKYYPLQTSYGRGTGGVSVIDPTTGFVVDGAGNRSWGAKLPANQPTYDHAREIFETGWGNDQTLSISGGSERTQFFLSGNYNYTNGMITQNNDVLKRITVRINGSHQASDRLKVFGNVAYANTNGRFIERGNNTTGIMLGGLRTPPSFNNLPFLNPDSTERTAFPGFFDNPFYSINTFQNTGQTDRVFGNVGAEWTALSWLKFNYTLGTDYYNDRRLEAYPVGNQFQSDGTVISGQLSNFQIDHNLVATATWKSNENLGGAFTVGQNLNHRRNTQFGTTGRTMIVPGIYNLQNTVARDPMVDLRYTRRVEGYFAQASVDIGQQLFLTAGGRYDGSSTYGVSNKWAFFPKASAAWNFIRSQPEGIVSYGKLRASYGEAGIEPNPYLLSVQTRNDLNGSGGVQGVQLQPTQNGIGGAVLNFERGDSLLKPERSKEFEAGIDLGLYKDKADLSFTFYNSRTSDVILRLPQAPSTGFQFVNTNAGEFRNRGIEVNLNIRPITSKDFGWDLGFQFGRNRNKVLSIAGKDSAQSYTALPGVNQDVFEEGIVAGAPFGMMRGRGFKKCGVTSADDPDVAASCSASSPVGALILGPDGYPIQDPTQRFIGNPQYNWTGSVRTSFRIRNLTIGGLVDVRNGGNVYNGTKAALYSYGTHKDTETRAACTDRNDPTSCTGNVKQFGSADWFNVPVVGPGVGADGKGIPVSIGEYFYRNLYTNFANYDEDFVEDGGFVRLREVSLQYSLNQPWVRRTLGFSSVDLRVAGRNLLTSTNYTGLDPETNLGQAESVIRGTDYFNLPQSRSFVFTVTLNR
jgi:TonB-linked SusC/RagA family outer membrane protein